MIYSFNSTRGFMIGHSYWAYRIPAPLVLEAHHGSNPVWRCLIHIKSEFNPQSTPIRLQAWRNISTPHDFIVEGQYPLMQCAVPYTLYDVKHIDPVSLARLSQALSPQTRIATTATSRTCTLSCRPPGYRAP